MSLDEIYRCFRCKRTHEEIFAAGERLYDIIINGQRVCACYYCRSFAGPKGEWLKSDQDTYDDDTDGVSVDLP